MSPLIFFMQRIVQILTNITQLDQSKIMKEIIDQPNVQDDIIKMNQAQLFESGRDSMGEYLGSYSFLTKQHKKEKFGSFPDHYTLFETGDFYKSMRVKNEPTYFFITANGQKEDDNLFQKFGENITGLDTQSIEELQVIVQPLFVQSLLNEILR